MLNKTKKWFTLIEIMVVVTIIWVLATMWIMAFNERQAKARDTARANTLKQLESWVLSFQESFGALPIASWVWEATDFALASWVSDWTPFKKAAALCTTRKSSPVNDRWNDMIWRWFGSYLIENVDQSLAYDSEGWDTAKYQMFQQKFQDQLSNIWGFIYKWAFTADWEFKYQIAVPLEKETITARRDWGKLGPRFLEMWNLIWTTDEMTKDDLWECFKWAWDEYAYWIKF